MGVNESRLMMPALKKNISNAFNKKDTKALVRLLLKTEVFPVKDSYIGFLRLKPSAVEENPKTIKRIGKRLYSLGLKRLLEEATRPKETNRQLGQSFKNFLKTTGIPMLGKEEFLQSKKLAFLKGNDGALKKFAEKELGCRLSKGIDFVLKKDDRFLIAEAKFLTTPGGEQNGGFADASTFVKGKSGRAKRVAIIDGYVWLETQGGLHNKIVKNKLDIFSALLLKDYIKGF